MDGFAEALDQGQISEFLDRDPSLLWKRHPRGITHLHLCAERGQVEGARALLNAGHPADVFDKDQRTPLEIACAGGNWEMASLLLGFGARATRWCSKAVMIHGGGWRREYSHARLRLLRLLLDHGVDLDSALHHAVEADFGRLTPSPFTELILERGADPNSLVDGRSPLHRLAESRNLGLVRRLLGNGAMVTLTDEHGRTALQTLCDREWCGCPKENAAELRALLEEKAEAELTNRS